MAFKIGYKKPEQTMALKPNRLVVATANEFQEALWAATPGMTIYVRGGQYQMPEGLVWIDQFGTEDAWLHIENYPGETPEFVNTQISFGDTAQYIRFSGMVIRDMIDLEWEGAVYFFPGVSNIIFENNEIYNIRCATYYNEEGELNYYGCNPLVLYGDMTYPTEDGGPFVKPISNITVRNNYIHDCTTGWSEALTLEGNVEDCVVVENTIDNTGNIGIDIAGNFPWTGRVGDPLNQPRNNYIARNMVSRCQSPYATSGGIYCDGSRETIIEQNIVYDSQCGIELGAEEPGAPVHDFYIRNNLVIKCGRGIGIGAYLKTGAEHKNTYVYNNTFICTNTHEENNALVVERTDNLHFKHNIIVGVEDTVLYQDWDTPVATNVFREQNCYFGPSSLSLPKGELDSFWADPLFVNNNYEKSGNYHLQDNSPCKHILNRFGLKETGFFDLDNNKRVDEDGYIDLGCYQTPSGTNEEVPSINAGFSLSQLNRIAFNGKRIGYIYKGTSFIKYKPRKKRKFALSSFLPSSDNVSVIASTPDSLSFKVLNNQTWEGVYFEMPKEWIGKPTMIMLEDFAGEGFCLTLQDDNTDELYMELNRNNLKDCAFVPNGHSATFYIQNKETPTTESCTVKGLSAYVDWFNELEGVTGDNLFPSWDSFTVEPGIDILYSAQNTIRFNVDAAWTGIRYAIPKAWQGHRTTLGCKSISPVGITLAIQSMDTWEFLTAIRPGDETSKTFDIPAEGNYQIMITTEDAVPKSTCELVDLFLYIDGVEAPEMPPANGTNVFPSYWSGYDKDSGVTLVSSNSYNVCFTTEKAWTGINTPLPANLYGKTIWFGCEAIAPKEFTMSIQSTTTWEFLTSVTAGERFQKIEIPDTNERFIINIQASNGKPSAACTITNAFIYEA